MATRRLALAAAAIVTLLLPADSLGVWIVRGAGFGHGVGLSAYGALGFAQHGYGYRRILGHYFPGTRVAVLPARDVRVLLATGARGVGFSGASAACGRTLDPALAYRARREGAGVTLVSASGRTLERCGAVLAAQGPGPVSLAGRGRYRGAIEVRAAGRGLSVISVVGLEDYLRGVLPAEVFPSWPDAALEALAVAMRSIALSTDVGGDGFALYADTRTQVYRGVAAETPRTDAVVGATRGQVVTYQGRPAQTTYFASSGGRTASGFLGAPKVPYLRSVDDPYDGGAPLHRWTLRFTQARMESRLRGYVRGRLLRIVVTDRGDSPRIDYARVVGSRGAVRIRGDVLQAALGLYSRWARFERRP